MSIKNKKFTFLAIFFLLSVALVYGIYKYTKTPKVFGILLWQKGPISTYKYNYVNYLNSELQKRGYTLKIFDVYDKSYDGVDILLITSPRYNLNAVTDAEHSYLWMLESPISVGDFPPDDNIRKHFKQIFSYDKKLCEKYGFKNIYMPYHYYNENFKISKKDRPVFLMQVAGYHYMTEENWKRYNFKKEVAEWGKREDISLWLAENHKDEYVLHGRNWDMCKNAQVLSVYKGSVVDKIATLRRSKFSLAFENAKHDGYITEKIFDCMRAGSIPIYFGAPDIYDYIPKNCFINIEDFSSYESLYEYLKNMTEEEYQSYLDNIEIFFRNFDKTPFYYTYSVDIILKEIFK